MDYSEILLRQDQLRKQLGESLAKMAWEEALVLAHANHAAARSLVVWLEERIIPIGHEESPG